MEVKAARRLTARGYRAQSMALTFRNGRHLDLSSGVGSRRRECQRHGESRPRQVTPAPAAPPRDRRALIHQPYIASALGRPLFSPPRLFSSTPSSPSISIPLPSRLLRDHVAPIVNRAASPDAHRGIGEARAIHHAHLAGYVRVNNRASSGPGTNHHPLQRSITTSAKPTALSPPASSLWSSNMQITRKMSGKAQRCV